MMSMTKRFEIARREESGFTTAELLGNAALGVIALGAIWALIGGDNGLAERIIEFIRIELTGS